MMMVAMLLKMSCTRFAGRLRPASVSCHSARCFFYHFLHQLINVIKVIILFTIVIVCSTTSSTSSKSSSTPSPPHSLCVPPPHQSHPEHHHQHSHHVFHHSTSGSVEFPISRSRHPCSILLAPFPAAFRRWALSYYMSL